MENNLTCLRQFGNIVQIENCRETLQDNHEAFTQLSGLLALAGSEVRLKILFLLEEERELCPCDLSDILEMSVPAISQHLRKLKDGNVIKSRREGQTIFYSLIPENLQLLKPLFSHIVNLKSKSYEKVF